MNNELVTCYATHPVNSASNARPRIYQEDISRRGSYDALGFRSARVARSEGVSTQPISGRQRMQWDREVLIQQSRDFVRNNAIYSGLIDSASKYIVGKGHQLQILTEDNDYNQTVEGLWREYWKYPEVTQTLSGNDLEDMVCKEILTCGDTALIKVKGGYLQAIESEQITNGHTNKNYHDGILTDEYGRIKSFSVCKYENGYISTQNSRPVRAENVIYVAKYDRPSSIRGLPPLQSAFPMILRLNDICDSEAIAWQTLARFAIAITAEGAQSFAYGYSVTDDTASTTTPEIADRMTELDSAIIFNGNPGEKITSVDRNLPGKDFGKSVKMFLRLLGLPLGMPLELSLLDWTDSNYSQSRAVLEHAKKTFERWQKLIQEQFLDKVLRWKIQTWVVAGLIPDVAYKNKWCGPAFPWLDPQKEADAYGSQMRMSMATNEDVLQSVGKDRGEFLLRRKQEVIEAIEIAKDIKEQTGYEGEVPYEVFCGLETPQKSESKSLTETQTEVIENGNNAD